MPVIAPTLSRAVEHVAQHRQQGDINGHDAGWEYCVSGDTLTLHTGTSSADGVMTLTR